MIAEIGAMDAFYAGPAPVCVSLSDVIYWNSGSVLPTSISASLWNCPHRRLAVERLVLDTADVLQAWKMVNSGSRPLV